MKDARNGKVQCLSTDEYTTIYLQNGILFSNRKEILAHSTTWINLRDIILSKTRQIWTEVLCDFCSYEILRAVKFNRICDC